MNQKVTHDGERWSNAAEDCIEIVEYNPEWPALFRTEQQLLLSVLPDDIDFTIEHFGSTAIPGIAAKPVIDILLICEYMTLWERFIEPLESLGYLFWKENPRDDRMFFVKGMPPHGEGRTHHVHVKKPADTKADLLFRDYMNQHPAEALEYVRVKRSLMNLFKTDRDAYSSGKGAYIDRVLRKAEKWNDK